MLDSGEIVAMTIYLYLYDWTYFSNPDVLTPHQENKLSSIHMNRI